LSKIEESVTNLLRATKELLETLTKWSRLAASDKEVSDVYVKLGSHFNIACRAFTAIGVETADLGNVPDILRSVLENTLSQEASPASLEVYLPKIREIIINLLQGLKKKQKKLGPRTKGDANGSKAGGPEKSMEQRQESMRRPRPDEFPNDSRPPRTSSLPPDAHQNNAQNIPQISTPGQSVSSIADSVRGSLSTVASSQPSFSTTSFENYDVSQQHSAVRPPDEPYQNTHLYEQPPSSPKPDALEALAQQPQFKRRASQRYSQFQIQKLTGSSPNGAQVFGSATPTPRVPFQARESTDSSRNRGSFHSIRNESPVAPTAATSLKRTLSVNTRTQEQQAPEIRLDESSEKISPGTPLLQTPADKLGQELPLPSLTPAVSATISEPPSFYIDTGTPLETPPPEPPVHLVQRDDVVQQPTLEVEAEKPASVEASSTIHDRISISPPPQSPKGLTIFIQLGRSMKKVTLTDELEDLSLNTLRLLFIAKFSYNPPSGEDFPEIYIQDPSSGVRYELEDIHDLKDSSIICLNVEILDEVKRHIDDGMASLRQVVEGVNQTIQTQAKAIQQVADKQNETSRLVTDLATRSPVAQTFSKTPSNQIFREKRLQSVSSITRSDRLVQVSDVKAIKKDFAVLRQTYNAFVTDVTANMTNIKVKAASVRNIAIGQSGGGMSEGRASLEAGKKLLGADADSLVTRVDDLQDTVEDLRKDVVSRGVRPHPRQIDSVTKELVKAQSELKKMSNYIKKEKPAWKKVWERELEIVCEDQQFFNLQEELVADLKDDLDKAAQTFALVEQCTEQQLKVAPGAVRSASIGFVPNSNAPLDPSRAKDSVLSEVRALQPNHENRLEAIERAERMRKKDLEGRTSPFKKELGSFVEENKLKKSGGVMEAERQRKAKDEELRKGLFKTSGDNSSVASEDSILQAIHSPGLDAAPNGQTLHDKGDVADPIMNDSPNQPALT